MSFYDVYIKYRNFDLDKCFRSDSSVSIQSVLEKDRLDLGHFIYLLSPQTENFLESMARKAQAITRNNFGNTVQLYTPMYLSNYCDNSCTYCGFNFNNNIERRKLNLEEVNREAQYIYSLGLKHILILTGESRGESSVSYIKDCVRILKKYFSSISIEVYPLTVNEYTQLVNEGVDGLTIYQEVYDDSLYAKMHVYGPKKDYKFRIDAPERGAEAGMRSISIGTLLGLGEWRKEVFILGLHAKYLQDKFPEAEIAISVPRIQPQISGFKPVSSVSDRNIAQTILALRIFLPRLGISLSTRENPEFREGLIPLGITKISAASTTAVGGHTIAGNTSQFEIQDRRNVDEIKIMLESKGYQPVFKDWLQI
ncbi:MAG: 2-iminoacetate synthase ThiH [Candidatus Omnitrophota bacterium]